MKEFIDLIMHSAPHRIIAIMFLITVAATLVIAALERWGTRRKSDDTDLLITRALDEGRSEYDFFAKSAATWRLSQEQVDEDFRRYLHEGIVPHYVRHVLRAYTEQDGNG